MYKFKFLSILIIGVAWVVFWGSCKSNSSFTKTGKTTEGYEYIHYVNSDGPKPQTGDLAYFSLISYIDETVLENTKKSGVSPSMKIPDTSKQKNSPGAVLEGLMLMSVGDSIKITIPLDSLGPRLPQHANNEFMYYHLKLESIKGKANN